MVGSAALQHRFISSFVGDRFLHPSQPFHQLFRYHPDVCLGKEVIKMYCSLPRYNKCKHLLNLSYLLRLSTISRALAQGMQVHQQIIQQGLDVNPFFLTKLLQFYAHLDHLRYAQKLFDKLSQPNVFAWTAVLAFQSRNGMFSECLQVYGEMRSKGVIPDEYVFPKVIRACAQLSCLDVGTSIHKEVIIYGMELSLQVCNPLIDMYSKCKDVGSARRIFDDMEERDLFSWNSIISGYVSNAFSMLAVELVNFMRLEGVEPDVVTRNAVMDAYCQIGMCAEALKVFAQIEEPNIISWTTLISGFSRNGKHETSLGIFRDMMNSGVVIPDVDSLSRTLVSCRHLGALRNGQEIHGYGIKFLGRCIFYSSAGPALLTMYSRCGRIHTASEVFELMDKFDAIAWNAMIVAFVDLEMRHSALECFMEMQIMGIKNDKTTISTVLPICELKLGKEIHAYVVRNSYDSDVSVLNALVWMYSKCGCLKTAQLVFSNMVTRDLVSWNTIVGSLAMHGQGQAALLCVQEMNSLGLSVDAVTLTSALSACSHSGLVDEGLELFHSMSRDFGLIPQIEHFACLVDMLARAGQLDEAVALLNQMPIKPDKHIWGTLLIASEAQRNVKFAQLAVENLLQLEPEKAGYYVTLSNLYARGGRWDDAISIRKQMESRGLVKPVGRKHVVMQLSRTLSVLSNLLFNKRNLDDLPNSRRKRLGPGKVSPRRPVPAHIPRPPYVNSRKPPGIASGPEVHDESGIECMRASGRLAAQVLEYAGTLVKPGITTDEIDEAVHQMIIDNDAYPSPLSYGGFPKSVCTSVNECICHGIPDSRPLEDGDIINIDVTVYLNGYHGDTSATFFCGDVDDEAKKLVQVTKECLHKAISICGPGVEYNKIGRTIQNHADKYHYGVVREFVGHGVGCVFHADPVILHFRNNDSGHMMLNQTFTIEPMLTIGSSNPVIWDDNWTVVTEDGSLSAQFEHTILITPNGAEIMTQC